MWSGIITAYIQREGDTGGGGRGALERGGGIGKGALEEEEHKGREHLPCNWSSFECLNELRGGTRRLVPMTQLATPTFTPAVHGMLISDC